tara:strand:+ start:214 stop:741 length:528 start_codon:yes stop_codon:yes gene_type:complete
MKIVILKKAWSVNANKFKEPYFHGNEVYYGETAGSVKESAVIDNACGKLDSDKYPTFLTIPIVRKKNYDKIKYNGKEILRYQIENEDRQIKIDALDKNKKYYVQDNRNYVGNAVLWWGKDNNSYVTDLAKAHLYSFNEIKNFNPRESDIIWESSHVKNAIRQYVDSQGLKRSYSV